MDRTERRTIVERALERSGLSARQFAFTVVLREPRTVYRWLLDQSPVPLVVARELQNRFLQPQNDA